MRTAAFGLLSKGTRLLSLSTNNAILEFLLEGVPQLTEYCLDSKKEVDAELKNVCEQFIGTAVDNFVSPLTSLLDKMDTLTQLAEEEGKDKHQIINQQPFAKPESVRKVVSEAYMMLKSKLPGVMESMSLYLASKETEYILFKPIKTKVLKVYKQLSQLVQENYSLEDQQIIGCPSQEQVSLLMAFR
ncbi:conserved oligomeric Golgi complex subunit 3-like [Rhopilema esculentum]